MRAAESELAAAGPDLGETLHRLADGIPRPRVVLRLEDLPTLTAAQHDAVLATLAVLAPALPPPARGAARRPRYAACC